MGKVAFVTGANGITGSAIVEHLISKTTSNDWTRIIASSRSPLAVKFDDPRVEFIALDFTQEREKLVAQMQATCADVTHAYFSSYVHADDFAALNASNRLLFETFLLSLEQVAPDLQNVTLQTGGKYYNVHLQPVPTPERESDPRLPATLDNFYFPQEDFLAKAQRGKRWTWNVIRPEAIIGTTPGPTAGMNFALTYALYFLVCARRGVDARMPTNQLYWRGWDASSYAPLLADLTLHASTRPDCANEAFNMNNGDVYSWQYMWPRLAAALGARCGPDMAFEKDEPKHGSGLQQEFSLAAWAEENRDEYMRMCDEAGVQSAKVSWDRASWTVLDFFYSRTWVGTLSVNKARKFGWLGWVDSFDAITETWERMKREGQLP